MAVTEHVHRFPTYTETELLLDRCVHLIGVPAAMVTAVIMVRRADATGDERLLATLTLYGVALVTTLGLSAAYNLTMPGPRKEALRRADRAMIFAMIAASYTPYALNTLAPADGVALCAAAWLLAGIGIGLELNFPRRYERQVMALYLCSGWLVLGLLPTFIDRLPGAALALLLVGGVVLSAGAYIHSRHGLRYHNAIWHMMVLIGAGLQVHALFTAFLDGG
jgi:hemolysin III